MFLSPVELMVELTPRARFDVIDVRRHAAELYGHATEFRILPSPRPEHLAKIQAVEGVTGAHFENGSIIVSSGDPLLVNPRIVRALVGAGAEVAYVSDRKASLEDVYLKIVEGT